MYRIKVKEGYNEIVFEFKSMEEVSIFTSTVLANAVEENTEVNIKEVKDNA